MKFTALILLGVLGVLAVHAATVGHRVAIGRGTVGAPVIVRLTAVPSPFSQYIFDIPLPPLNTAYTWHLEGTTNLIDWYVKSYTASSTNWGVVKAAQPHEFYRLVGN